MCAKECIGSFGELARGDVSSPEAAFDRADRRLEIVASYRRTKDATRVRLDKNLVGLCSSPNVKTPK